MAKTYFIADLHLSNEYPELTELFINFMRQHATQAEAVYILGDLFDFWVGDDEQSPLIDIVQQQITHLTQLGIGCFFIHGNRDFLLGHKFAQKCGLQFLPDYQLLNLYGQKTLICHGDTFCIDDIAYQSFRRKVHQKWRQYLFLALPLCIRLKIAQRIRLKSCSDKQNKSTEIMDVNSEYVRQVMQNFDAELLIHGHTHRQGIHHSGDFTRIVLGDWGKTASILEVSNAGYTFISEQNV